MVQLIEVNIKMHIGEALDEYVASKRGEMKPKTLSEAKRIIGAFVEWCEGKGIGLEQVRSKVIQEYIGHLLETHKGKDGGRLSTHTVYLITSILKAFLSWCAEDEEFGEYIQASTVRKIKAPRQEKYVVETLSKRQIEALLKACDTTNTGSASFNAYLQDRDRAIVMLLIDTGIRAEELCTLTMKYLSLNPNDAYIRVRGKGDKWREVGLGERCRKELRRYVSKHRRDVKGSDEPVFLTRRGEPMQVQTLYRMVRRLGDEAGIEGVHTHQFRHTYATTFMRESGDIYRLSKLLGHSNITTTTNYLKSFSQQDARRGAISPLDSL